MAYGKYYSQSTAGKTKCPSCGMHTVLTTSGKFRRHYSNVPSKTVCEMSGRRHG